MKTLLPLLVATSLLLPAAPAEAGQQRSAKAKAEFKYQNPCPSTWKRKGACPGYVVDHIEPLCAGGADRPHNMQWQTIEEGKLKDRAERKQCSRYNRRR